MINIFSWHTNGQVGLPIQGKISFSGETSDSVNLHGSVVVPVKKEKLDRIKEDIENCNGTNAYLDLYRFAFLNEDQVSKFLILYSILIKGKAEEGG